MRAPGKAVIVGGSLGGLFAGHLLLRAGWDVQVYERAAEELQARGAGIVTHPELMAALERAGVVVDETIGVKVDDRITLGPDGRRLASLNMPQTFAAWSRLFAALRAVFPDERYHNGRHLVSFSQDSSGVEAIFADGERAAGDILIAADGARSSVRQILLPLEWPHYAGYVAWRGLVEESALSASALRDLFPFFAFCLPPGEQMIGYPVAGRNNAVGAGRRRFNFVWYRPAAETTTLRALVTDGSGKVWHDGIPPPLIREEVREEIRLAARAVLAPQFAEVVEKTENLFFQPIYDLACPRIAFGRVVLLGDAAFVARPHCGMGVTKAAGDAVELADCLQRITDPVAALQAYEAPRLCLGRRIVSHARELGAYMQAQLLAEEERDKAERTRAPVKVMRETAVPLAAPGTSGGPASRA
jgi:2-polyprenyl-6-methoxyphenol hydroxylase-like FAD-dependent oxidoreductase